MSLTDRTCQKKATGKDEWIAEAGRRGAGRLYFRLTKAGARLFYFRYTTPEGERVNIKVGEYDPAGGKKGKLTLKQAAAKANELSLLYQAGNKDLRGYLEREQRQREEQVRAEEASRRYAEEDARRGTFGQLLAAYVESLERRGKVDARDAANLFKNHVQTHIALCVRKANQMTPADLRPVLAEIIDAGKGRTAAKVRSYIRAAFSSAIRAENDPTAPASLLGFGLQANPADVLSTLREFNKASDRVLNEEELRGYMLGVDAMTHEVAKSCLKLSLLLGGQRPTQMLRVRPVDLDLTAKTLTIRDSKGARTNPRLHVLPLDGEALTIATALYKQNVKRPYLFAQDDESPIYRELLSGAATEISAKLLKDGVSRAPFRLGDIRRTCETMLAAMGISSDLRAQIQSHGLSGVQAKHYDRHSYADEKRAALKAWAKRINAIRTNTQEPKNITRIRKTAA